MAGRLSTDCWVSDQSLSEVCESRRLSAGDHRRLVVAGEGHRRSAMTSEGCRDSGCGLGHQSNCCSLGLTKRERLTVAGRKREGSDVLYM